MAVPIIAAVTEFEAKKMLSEYGINVPRNIILKDSYAKPEFKGPYVVKVSDQSVLHKTEVGGVIVGISTDKELQMSFETMKSRFPHSDVMIEQMLPGGVEMIAGVLRDPQFGLVIMAGLGGIYAELLKDRAFRLVPVSRKDAEEMVMQTRISEFVRGFRGMSISLDSICDLIVNLSNFAMDHEDEIEGVDLNPVIGSGSDIAVADAKIMLHRSKIIAQGGE